MPYYDRSVGKLEKEKVYFEKSLRFLYTTRLGGAICLILSRFSIFSKMVGFWQNLSFTRKKILPFIEAFHIRTEEFEKPPETFVSFNDFFTRALRQGARSLEGEAICPADGRYLVFPDVSKEKSFQVKGQPFTLEKLLQDPTLSEEFRGGSLVLIRLAPCDYHRFHFPFDCTPSEPKLINGPLYSVNPIALKRNIGILCENKRVLCELESQDFGKVLFIEIGATNVGSIHQTFTPYASYKKGEEKGYFSFGGSSIILLFKPKRIEFARDLLEHSREGVETRALFGQKLSIN